MSASFQLVTTPDPSPVERFAAEELIRYLNEVVEPTNDASAPRVYVGTCATSEHWVVPVAERVRNLPEDSFAVISLGEDLVILGQNGRGTLYAVYAYLETLGARWAFPGPDGEVRPSGPFLTTGYDICESPDFAGRGITYYPYRHGDPVHWIDFLPKLRLNHIFMHVDVESWEELEPTLDWWNGVADQVVPEIERRGLTWELGGHLLRGKLLLASEFEAHPEFFREYQGQRSPDFNLCTASRSGIQYVQSQLLKWADMWPGASVHHVWPNDIDGGGWCECSECRDMSPSDQSLRLANSFSAVLRDSGSSQRVAYLAYHDTLQPPVATDPDRDLVLYWAPRERCYACALDDPNCRRNQLHMKALVELTAKFAGRQINVYEYYLDGILYQHLQPQLLSVMAEDLRTYKRLGVHTVAPLLVNLVPYVSPPIALLLYPRLLWNVDFPPSSLLDDHAAAQLGDSTLAEAFRHIDDALVEVLRSCDSANPVSTCLGIAESITLDMLDAHVQRLEYAERKLVLAADCFASVSAAYRLAIEAERRLVSYQLRVVQALLKTTSAHAALRRVRSYRPLTDQASVLDPHRSATDTLNGTGDDAVTVVLNSALVPPTDGSDGRQHRAASELFQEQFRSTVESLGLGEVVAVQGETVSSNSS